MFLIRSMTPFDLNQVCLIENRVHLAPWGVEVFNHCLLLEYRCRVAVISNQTQQTIIGYCISRKNNQSHHILNLAVDLDYQRSGYARQMLEELIKEVSNKNNINQLVLEVRPSNVAALKLYHQYGFQQSGIKKDYYQDENGCEDALILSRLI